MSEKWIESSDLLREGRSFVYISTGGVFREGSRCERVNQSEFRGLATGDSKYPEVITAPCSISEFKVLDEEGNHLHVSGGL